MNELQLKAMLTIHLDNEFNKFIEENSDSGLEELDEISRSQYFILNGLRKRVGQHLNKEEAKVLYKFLPLENKEILADKFVYPYVDGDYGCLV